MAKRGRPVTAVVLTDEERETLQRWARRAKSSQALAQRCRIVLGCAAGKSNKEVAAEVGVWPQTVCKWRQRFVESRLDGLTDEPRPGAPRTIDDERIELVVVSTLERQPTDATHWSRASMAKESGLSKSTVGRIWKAFGLKPHLVDTFKLSNDPQFIDKVRDVVGLYLDPPEKALVLCVDEKSQIQALDRSAPVLPMMPGLPERRTHDYVRHGITTLRFNPSSTPCRRVQEVLGQPGWANPRRVGCASDLRQLHHPQDTYGRQVVGRPPSIPHAPHPDLLILAQPGRALVRAPDRPEAAPRRPPINPGLRERHSRLDRSLEPRPSALHLVQDRRRNPRKTQLISSTDSWRRTLGISCVANVQRAW